MSLTRALIIIMVAGGLLYLDIAYNQAAVVAYVMNGFIGVVEWIAFWR